MTGGAEGQRPPIDIEPARPPLIGDYAVRRRTFTWKQARGWLDGLPGGGLNIAHEAVDRHARGPLADTVAVRFLSRTAPRATLTYRQLARHTDIAAVALQRLSIERGDRVCTLLPRSPELYLTALGTLKAGAVYCPLFPAFGMEPVRQRLELGGVRVLVTDAESWAKKVLPVRDQLPALETVVLVDGPAPAPSNRARRRGRR